MRHSLGMKANRAQRMGKQQHPYHAGLWKKRKGINQQGGHKKEQSRGVAVRDGRKSNDMPGSLAVGIVSIAVINFP